MGATTVKTAQTAADQANDPLDMNSYSLNKMPKRPLTPVGKFFRIWGLPIAAVLFVLANVLLAHKRSGASFALSSLAIALTTVGFFAGLFPRLMVSSIHPAYSLTIENAASSPYTLSVMTVAAAIFVPIVLIYQSWSYYIFRKRVTPKDAEEHY